MTELESDCRIVGHKSGVDYRLPYAPLHRIHLGIGCLQRIPRSGDERGANAHAQSELTFAKIERSRQGELQSSSKLFGALERCVDQSSEHISAQTSEIGIAGQRRLKSVRHLSQDVVASSVALVIIDRLKAIEIELE